MPPLDTHPLRPATELQVMLKTPNSMANWAVGQNLRKILSKRGDLTVLTWYLIGFVLELAGFPKFVLEDEYCARGPGGYLRRVILRHFDPATDSVDLQWKLERGLKLIASASTLHVHGTQCLLMQMCSVFKKSFLDEHGNLRIERLALGGFLSTALEIFPPFGQVLDAYDSRASLTSHNGVDSDQPVVVWRRDVSLGGEYVHLPAEFGISDGQFRNFGYQFSDWATAILKLVACHWKSLRQKNFVEEVALSLSWDGIYARLNISGRHNEFVDYSLPTNDEFDREAAAGNGYWWVSQPRRQSHGY